MFNYYLAFTIIKDNKNAKESFKYLKKYLDNYNPSFGGYSLDNIYYLYAKAYYQLNDLDQAKKYNLKALDLNSENSDALMLKKIIN
ncbi:MAG: hypothetical protein V4548_06675 [Bacteroidota bacterium]